MLVVRDHLPDSGVRLEQRPRYRRRNDIDRTVIGREGGKQRRRQHDVAKEGRLNDERWHNDENLTLLGKAQRRMRRISARKTSRTENASPLLWTGQVSSEWPVK